MSATSFDRTAPRRNASCPECAAHEGSGDTVIHGVTAAHHPQCGTPESPFVAHRRGAGAQVKRRHKVLWATLTLDFLGFAACVAIVRISDLTPALDGDVGAAVFLSGAGLVVAATAFGFWYLTRPEWARGGAR